MLTQMKNGDKERNNTQLFVYVFEVTPGMPYQLTPYTDLFLHIYQWQLEQKLASNVLSFK